ncbi:MAG: nitroreductase family protein [Rikenellaceae bacterium]|nr:nitroreductase family protein [Rikenellaceae bacterium]
MDFRLTVNQTTCIGCRRCIRVCPAAIFYQPESRAEILLRNVSFCIRCGHCVAVCPTGSVEHSLFPAEKVHQADPTLLPTPESLMLLCKSRRSNRGFSKKPVPEPLLDQILEAAHRAPTASNRQEVSYVCITDPGMLHRISQYTIDQLARGVKLLKNPILKPVLKPFMRDNYTLLRRLERLLKEHAKGNDPILRQATALILILTPKQNRFGRDDANLVYQNGSLMAESLGVAQFYTGYLCTAVRRDKKTVWPDCSAWKILLFRQAWPWECRILPIPIT